MTQTLQSDCAGVMMISARVVDADASGPLKIRSRKFVSLIRRPAQVFDNMLFAWNSLGWHFQESHASKYAIYLVMCRRWFAKTFAWELLAWFWRWSFYRIRERLVLRVLSAIWGLLLCRTGDSPTKETAWPATADHRFWLLFFFLCCAVIGNVAIVCACTPRRKESPSVLLRRGTKALLS